MILHVGPGPTSPLGGWITEPALAVAASAPALLYLRGWLRLHRRRRSAASGPELAAFQGGLLVLLVAVASPLDALADRSLSCHMTQHVLLMLVAPPLLWLGSPLRFLLLGLPRVLGRWLARLPAHPPLRALARQATRPATCWIVFVATTWVWHLPSLYEWALRDEVVHDAEHLCFLAAGLLFWWPVVRPWPARPRGPLWWCLPYLTLAMLGNTVFSAVFTFADRVLYPSYLGATPPWEIAPLTDQALAGAIMWVGGSLTMAVPAVFAVMRLLGPGALRTGLAPPGLERAAR